MDEENGLRRYDAEALLSRPAFEIVINKKTLKVYPLRVAQMLELAAAKERKGAGKPDGKETTDDEFLYLVFKDQGLTREDLRKTITAVKALNTRMVLAAFFAAQVPAEVREIPGIDRVEAISTGFGASVDSFARTLGSGSKTS